MVLVDAGPLVALIDSTDRHHERCREASRAIPAPVGAAWPVITEAMYLLNCSWQAQDTLWDSIQNGAHEVFAARPDGHCSHESVTLDRRDFEIYRPAKLGRFSLTP